jgi:hypothetical protein
LLDQLDGAADERLVLQGRDGGLVAADRQVEGQPDAVVGVGDMRRAIAPADPEGRQAMDRASSRPSVKFGSVQNSA